MHLKVIYNKNKEIINHRKNDIPVLLEKKNLIVMGSDIIHEWENENNDLFYVSGYIIGERDLKNNLIPIKNYKFLENPETIDRFEGRFVCIKIGKSGDCKMYYDNYGRSDLYWLITNDQTIISTTLKDLPIKGKNAEIDQIGLSQSLTIYGSRPLKKHTLYKNVKRLGVNEILTLKEGNIKIFKRDFKPLIASSD